MLAVFLCHFMEKSMRQIGQSIGIIALLAFITPASTPVFAQAISSASATPEIIVTGVGQVTVKPDIAYISLGVVTRGKQASAISQQNAAKTAAVIKAITASGIPTEDIRTEGYELSADDNEDGKKTVQGYSVSNTIRVRVRVLTKVGKVLDTALKAGVNVVNNVQFGLTDPQKAQDEALRIAVTDANRQAMIAAKAANITNIQLARLQVGGGYEAQSNLLAEYAQNNTAYTTMDSPIRAGQQTVTVMVSARFVAQEKAPVLTP